MVQSHRSNSVATGASRNAKRQRMTKVAKRSKLVLELLEDRRLMAADFAANELLVQYALGWGETDRTAVRTQGSAMVLETIHTPTMKQMEKGAIERLQIPSSMSVDDAVKYYASQPGVVFAEPNYVIQKTAVSNDPYYTTSGRLWGMYSDDSPTAAGPTGTTNVFGSQAEQAWNAGDIGSSSVVIGIIDEGIDFNHPDLDANIWVNPFETVDGIDNDGNGYIDDIRGWDFFNDDNSIYDGGTEDSHGTHVAGTIGGEGNNGIGVAGVNWNVKMISAKFLGATGGYTSDAIRAVDYLTDLKTRHGIDIVASNNSWGGGGYSQSLHEAILRHAKADILFIAAAGNSTSNNDATASYPSNYTTLQGTSRVTAADYEGVIAVAAITSTGGIASFSSYGATTVDIGAPGASINSTVPNGGYAAYSGTSMATPHVTGAAALYAAKYPDATAAQIRSALLNSAVATSSLTGKTTTGGRLDVAAALAIAPNNQPRVSVTDAQVVEGNSGQKSLVFTASLSASSTSQVSVNFATANDTATAGSDYVANSGTLVFAPGSTSQTFSVLINGDTAVEANESFFVNLSGAVGASILDGQGVGTITNDDVASVGVSISDASGIEGNRNTRNLTFTISLSQTSTSAITVNYATANNTAIAGSDYNSKSGSVTIRAGRTSASVTVAVRGDRTVEANETFYVNITSVTGGTIVDGQGVGTILNDDGNGGGSNGEPELGGASDALKAFFSRIGLTSADSLVSLLTGGSTGSTGITTGSSGSVTKLAGSSNSAADDAACQEAISTLAKAVSGSRVELERVGSAVDSVLAELFGRA